MKALEILLAYAKLPAEEQGQVNQLLSILHKDRAALSQIQKEMTACLEEDTPSDNVIPIRPRSNGRKPIPNGPTAIVRELLASNPDISFQEAVNHATRVNPGINRNTFSATFYAERRKVA